MASTHSCRCSLEVFLPHREDDNELTWDVWFFCMFNTGLVLGFPNTSGGSTCFFFCVSLLKALRFIVRQLDFSRSYCRTGSARNHRQIPRGWLLSAKLCLWQRELHSFKHDLVCAVLQQSKLWLNPSPCNLLALFQSSMLPQPWRHMYFLRLSDSEHPDKLRNTTQFPIKGLCGVHLTPCETAHM